MNFVKVIIDKKGRELEIYQLFLDSYQLVDDFYQLQIEQLDNKEYFFPYTEIELRAALTEGRGYFIGAFYNKKLISLSAIDFDSEYGDAIRELVRDNYIIPSDIKVFEYSGVMVDYEFRQAGLASDMLRLLKEYAQEKLPKCYLCAVIQITNYVSLHNFFNNGFSLEYIRKVDERFQFGYTFSPINIGVDDYKRSNAPILESDIDCQIELLKTHFGCRAVRVGKSVFIEYHKRR